MKLILIIVILSSIFVSNSWARCSFQSDCPSGFQCRNGNCVAGRWPRGGCSFDSDCPDGYSCNSGDCTPGDKSYNNLQEMLKLNKPDC